MPKVIGIGHQDFEKIRENNNFYIDKTNFIKEWWESNDEATLIARPRRFGKTLNMSMTEKFFSLNYMDRGDLFEGLSIWEDNKYRRLQGTYPVLAINFAKVKETSFINTRKKICQIITNLYNKYSFLLDSGKLNENEKKLYLKVSAEMEDYIATDSLNALSDYLMRYYGKKVIILLDEYDTPMQEAYINGYWDELAAFIRNLFNATFKSNPYMERAIMTGITIISKESIFSDLNNLEVITATSEKYAECFGFTEQEVFASLKEYGLSGQEQLVKNWYNGFSFGKRKDIYNPWSVISFLSKKKAGTYWANTSSNNLIGKLIRESGAGMKEAFERLMRGESIRVELNEQIVYNQLSSNRNAVWSLLLASGYLKVIITELIEDTGCIYYQLALTNKEVRIMFSGIIRGWFSENDSYNDFIKAFLSGDIKAMNIYMNKFALQTFSFFDTGKHPSVSEPERFYHGFVLGIMVELADRYTLTSNRESGFGRYDIMLEPKNPQNDAFIIEFKVQDTDEKELSDTVQKALRQIETKKYDTTLIAKGIPKNHIRKYGFAFSGKNILIGTSS